MNNLLQTSPYIRIQRKFPFKDLKELASQVDQAYIDIAGKINARTIGIFADNFQTITGEQWYLAGSSQRQQTLRQVYLFEDADPPVSTILIPHGISLNTITNFTAIYGTFFDGTNWNPLPYVDVASATNQINIKVGPSNIIITKGAGSPPTIANGLIVLEWLSIY